MSFWSSSTARFRWGIPLTSDRKSSDSTDMSGFRSPASAKMLTTPSDATALETICLMAESRSSCVLCSLGAFFRIAALNRLEEVHVVPYPFRLIVRVRRDAKALVSSITAWRNRSFWGLTSYCRFDLWSLAVFFPFRLQYVVLGRAV